MKRERTKRWRRCPEAWEPNDEHREIARKRGVSFVDELVKFRDHDFNVPKSDADATFRNWLRRAHPVLKPLGGQRAGDFIDGQKQRVAALEAVERKALP